jgi:hypothetical protein
LSTQIKRGERDDPEEWDDAEARDDSEEWDDAEARDDPE